MNTFLDNIIRPCAQKSQLWLVCTIGLAVLVFLMFPGAEGLDASPKQAAAADLLSERNCLIVEAPSDMLEAPNNKLSSENLAKLTVKYSPQKKSIAKQAERSKVIEPVLNLKDNKQLKCGGPTEDSQSLCFKSGERKFCVPLNQ